MKELILGGARSGKSALAEQRARTSGIEVSYIATAGIGDAEMAARIAMHRARRPDRWRLVEEPVALAAVLRREAAAKRCVIVDCLTLWLSNLLADGIDDGNDAGGTTPGMGEAERRREQPPRATAVSDVHVSRGTCASRTSRGAIAEARATRHDARDGGDRAQRGIRAEGGRGCGLGADSAPAESPTFVRERAALLDTLPALPGYIILISNEVGMGIVPLGPLSRRFCDEAGRLHQDLARICDRVILTVAGLPYMLKGDRL